MAIKQKPIDTRFFNFDEGTLERVSHEYGVPSLNLFFPILTDGDACSLLETRSATSRKIILGSSGDLKKKFFLKQIPWYCDDQESVTESHEIQSHLYSRGCSLPAIYKTSEGKTWLEFGREKYVLFEYLQGRRYSGTLEDIQRSAVSLAKIHLSGIPKSISGNSESIEEIARNHITMLQQNGGNQEEIRILHQAFSDSLLGLEIAGYYDCPLSILHGDFSPWNLIFCEGKMEASVIDFDNTRIAPRVEDIAESLLTFFHTLYKADSTNINSFHAVGDRQGGLIFMDSYSSVAGLLTEIEQKCLAHVGTLKFIELYSLARIRGDFSYYSEKNIRQAMSDCCDHFEILSKKYAQLLRYKDCSVNPIGPRP